MGNHNSIKKRLKLRHKNKNEEKENFDTDGDPSTIEDFEGTSPDSYEKLIAWMIEMSENDDVALNSNNFVEHLAKVCAEKQRKQTFLSTSPRQHPLRQHSLDSSTYHSVIQPRSRYSDYNIERPRVPFKQHSYDAATFHSVSPGRQSSVDSNNGLLTVNTPLRQHSSDSSCSSRSRYSKTSRANSRSREDLLDPRTRFRRAMFSRQGTVDYSDGETPDFHDMDISGGSSFEHDSDTDIVDPSSVLLNKGYRETSFIKDNRRNVKTDNDITYHGISSSVGDLLHTRTGGFGDVVRNKSKSLTTMRRIKSETRNDDEITPITETDENITILEDSLLDGNIADILFSVEALWPKGCDKMRTEFY